MTLSLTGPESQFLADHHRAAMITLRTGGSPHVAQVGAGLVEVRDGTQRLRGSGTETFG